MAAYKYPRRIEFVPSLPMSGNRKDSQTWLGIRCGTDFPELDPEWTELYMKTAMQPWNSGVLSPQVIQLLCIAVDAASTHMYAPGVRRHIRAALDMGVTRRDSRGAETDHRRRDSLLQCRRSILMEIANR
ncbi:unnamed protein product, partial [Mesorhabditis spiculigera]